MAESKKFHFIADTSLGHIDGDLLLEIDGNDLEGSFEAFGVNMHLKDGHYDNGHFTGSFSEMLLLMPITGTLEGQIEGDACTLTINTSVGSRTMQSV